MSTSAITQGAGLAPVPWAKRRWRAVLLLLAFVTLSLLVLAVFFEWRVQPHARNTGDAGDAAALATAPQPDQVQRGAYLARAGNCAGCHTARGGAAMAGGRAIATPFGDVVAANLTPHASTGLGAWSADDFWRALHEGRSRDGRVIVPACPYPHYTLVTRADTDALHAWLRSLPPVHKTRPDRALTFPYGLQLSLAAWQWLYFKPASLADDPMQSALWNRGRYLVQGLGHCAACHGERNALGATRHDWRVGGVMSSGHWYAPSLASAAEAGVADWVSEDVVALLKHGKSARASAIGPMAEVVFNSTQHLSDTDLAAMATFLRALPQAAAPRAALVTPVPATSVAATTMPATASLATTAVSASPRHSTGASLYKDHCADCHGTQGEGVVEARAPALAGNRALTMAMPNNVVQVILHGGFTPATPSNPQPYGMPPFAHVLDDAAVAAITSHLRQSWGHNAAEVRALDVLKLR